MSELMVEPVRHGPFPGRLDSDAIAAYAATTRDQTAAVRTGLAVPAVFPVILVFAAQEAARADMPAAAWERAHGLCTMAICTHRLLSLLSVDDPGRVSRVAVRFASPTPLDEELTVKAYGIDDRRFAFEATSRGVKTITHGRLELRS